MSYIKTFEVNTKGRDFFVTDIHGHFDLLHESLNNVAFNGDVDRLFVGGDNCDRGPHSHTILDYLSLPWYNSVAGNHEEMVIQVFEDELRGPSTQMLYTNGGEWFFDLDSKTQEKIYKKFKSLPLGIEFTSRSGKKVGIVHAQCPYNNWDEFKNITRAECEWDGKAVAQWSRTRYDYQKDDPCIGVDVLLCGHTPTKSGDVEILGNQWYCDAGSFFRDKLNLIEIE